MSLLLYYLFKNFDKHIFSCSSRKTGSFGICSCSWKTGDIGIIISRNYCCGLKNFDQNYQRNCQQSTTLCLLIFTVVFIYIPLQMLQKPCFQHSSLYGLIFFLTILTADLPIVCQIFSIKNYENSISMITYKMF